MLRWYEGYTLFCHFGGNFPSFLHQASIINGVFSSIPHHSLLFPLVLSCFSCFLLFLTLWTVASQGPLSMGFSRQEYWSGPFHSPGDLPYSGIEPKTLMSPALAGGFFTTSAIGEAPTFSLKKIANTKNL